MKKLLAVFIVLSLALLSAGCGSSPVQATPAPTPAPTQAAEASPEATQDAEASPAAAAAPEAVSAQTAAEETPAEPAQENKSLVVVFSCTGTTKGIAEKIPDARPEIANDISLDGVTTLYLGYPIWWGQAPRIMSTFVESHNFTGITVIPFCTSGSSGAGRTGETLGEQAGTGTFLSSTRFSSGVSDAELQSWIDSHS